MAIQRAISDFDLEGTKDGSCMLRERISMASGGERGKEANHTLSRSCRTIVCMLWNVELSQRSLYYRVQVKLIQGLNLHKLARGMI